MTPDQLREKGNRWRELGQYDLANIYNQHAAALEEIERLNAAWKAQQFHLEAEERESAHWQERAEQAERRAERLQAQVDALMLEYCPDEMTPEQLAEWEKHQRAVPAEFRGERRAERLKVHAEAMADAIQFGDMAILTVAKAAADSYRSDYPKDPK